MRLKKIFMTLALTIVGTMSMMAQMEMPPIPFDPEVRQGKLDNGLTYYIRYNNWPEHRAEFYIAQKVGSLQENDDQRGLAHFLEHMCFNGTENFPGNGVIRYCESIGVQFGRDLNAYTSIDRTVYNISNVPTTSQAALDSCLLILHDWADGLLLEPEEIDKERGVIHEEWRLRSSATQRMFERSLPALYPGSKYGHRMPIGLMEIIDNFQPQFLRDYYEKWYRPDNQGIIVVGDVDVDHVEAKIKEIFGGIKMPENPAPVELVAVPDNAEPIYIVEKDKEQMYNIVELMFKHDPMPDEMKSSMAYLITEYVKQAALKMLNDRMEEYAKKPDCPYLQSSAEYGQYIYAKTKDAFTLGILPKENQTEAALQASLREARRAAEFGFTATEYSRYKADYLSQLEKAYSNKDKRYNGSFTRELVEYFLENEPMPGIDYEYQTMKQIAPMIPLEAVNQVMAQFVLPNDTNLVVINFNTEKDGVVYPTVEGLKSAVAAARAEQIEAYVDNVKDEPLITELPKAGKIVKTEQSDKFDYKTLTLSNGATVVLKQTDYKKDQVLLRAEGFGGSSLYGEQDFPNLKMFNEVIEASGLGNFSHTELEKALAGKVASAGMSLGETRQYVEGSSTPTDVETMLQLVYLYFTKINKDQESFDNTIQTTETMLKNKDLMPEAVWSDSLTLTMTSHNPRFAPLKAEDLQHVSYDRVLEIAKERLSNAAAFTFTIVGNYDEATLLPLLEQYIASLPSDPKHIVKGKDTDTSAKGLVINEFRRKMETPKANTIMTWTAEGIPYSLENSIKADMAGQVLSMVYLKKIREDASAAYSVQAQGQATRDDYRDEAMILAYCPMKPEKQAEAMQILRDEVPELAKTCDADMLAKVKEFMLKRIDDQAKTNRYWISIIRNWRVYGLDTHTAYKDLVQAQTPESVSAYVAELLKQGNHLEVTILPEE